MIAERNLRSRISTCWPTRVSTASRRHPIWAVSASAAYDAIADVVIAFAGGCLTTTFVGLQHFGPVLSVAIEPIGRHPGPWLGPLCSGERRAGIALAGLRPGPAQVHVAAVPGGYLVTGETTWVTGWGLIDTLQVAARDEYDVIHFLLLDAVESADPDRRTYAT